jgi:hypothetical protein
MRRPQGGYDGRRSGDSGATQEDDVTAFTVWKFDTPDGAENVASHLESAAGEGLIKILDHAVVSWPVGARRRPTTKHSHDSLRRGGGWRPSEAPFEQPPT